MNVILSIIGAIVWLTFSSIFLSALFQGGELINFAMFLVGLSLVSTLVGSYIINPVYDIKFKYSLMHDEKLNSKFSMSIIPVSWVISFRLFRYILYARNIVIPKKNWIQKSLFGDYDFRKYARFQDYIVSYFTMVTLGLGFFLGVIYGFHIIFSNPT